MASVAKQAKQVYLTAYNLAQVGLWSVVILQTLQVLWFYTHANTQTQKEDYPFMVWEKAGGAAKLAVGGAWLELLHVLLGLAGGSAASAGVQNFGRWFVLFMVCDAFETGKHTWWMPSLLLAWGVSELIRYPFYIFGSSAPPSLTWLRYSAFLPLYPWGMASEVALLYLSLPEVKEAVAKTNRFCLFLPGGGGVKLFNFHYFIIFGLAVLYPLAGPYMYMYMLKQRKKRVGGGGGKKAAAGEKKTK